MNDLPLNGRNFTELLLTILPGTVNLNTDQNSGGGGGWNGASIGQFSFPAVNGARNRSNMFILDGGERSEHAVRNIQLCAHRRRHSGVQEPGA
jgi:hypothetical protein